MKIRPGFIFPASMSYRIFMLLINFKAFCIMRWPCRHDVFESCLNMWLLYVKVISTNVTCSKDSYNTREICPYNTPPRPFEASIGARSGHDCSSCFINAQCICIEFASNGTLSRHQPSLNSFLIL